LDPFSDFRELIVSPPKRLQKRVLLAEVVRSPRMKLGICKRLKELIIHKKSILPAGDENIRMILVGYDHSNIFVPISEQDISIYFLRRSEDGLGARNSFSTVRNHLDFTERFRHAVISL
jgi:hypothetical protein